MNLFNNGSGLFTDVSIFPSGDFEVIGMDEIGILEPGSDYMSDPIQYLQKGEKILSLLKVKEPKPFQKNRVLELVRKNWDLTLNAMKKQIGTELETQFLYTLGNDVTSEKRAEACRKLSQELLSVLEIESEERVYQNSFLKNGVQHHIACAFA